VKRLRLPLSKRVPRPADNGRPILAVDIDGVVSLFGFDEPPTAIDVDFQLMEGKMHCLSITAARHLEALAGEYEPVWVTGWEQGAHRMAQLLELADWPYLTFDGAARFGSADWKLAPLGRYARGRALAWLDDSFDEACYEWARQREEPTLLVGTESETGLLDIHAEALAGWARSLAAEEGERSP
jgi:fructose 1,6-bisphosphatase